MDILISVLKLTDISMQPPAIYGPYHILCLVLVALAAAVLCLVHKKRGTTPHKVLLFIGLLCILLETYKQLDYTFSYSAGIQKDYQWYAFPFQFCSTPMYVALLAGLFPKGKFHNALSCYLATFSLFAGLCVMVYPGDVFCSDPGINIQTMICHGAMVVMGVYLLYSGYVKTDFLTLRSAAAVFAVCVSLAGIMNEVAYQTGLLERETFNMFFISPHCPPSLPVYSLVQNVVPYPLSLVIYIAGFTAAAEIILLVAKGIQTLSHKKAHV